MSASLDSSGWGFPRAVTALRRLLLQQGYAPVPAAGKASFLPHWREAAERADDAELRRWEGTFTYQGSSGPRTYRGHEHTNTGIACGRVVGVDIDVPVPALAARLEALALAMLAGTRLRRIGRAPKVLLCYRAAGPMVKCRTPELFLPDGTKVQVEALGQGQQFVAYGVHPDTGREYEWPDLGPDAVPVADLPAVTEDTVKEFIGVAETMLRQAGGMTKAERKAAERGEPQPAPRRAPMAATVRQPAEGEGFFRAVNTAALANLDAWVPSLFPRAKKQDGTGAWRVTSKDLGRAYEEDLSLHPAGIRDFGSETSLTPIDVVMAWGGTATPTDAALMLCEAFCIQPEALGWSGGPRKPRQQAKGKAGGDGIQGRKDAGQDEWPQVTDKGKPVPNLANVMHALRTRSDMHDLFALDEMAHATLLTGPIPSAAAMEGLPRPVRDSDVSALQERLQLMGMERLGRDTVHQAVDQRATERAFHPVRDYLNGLHWDGKPRVWKWLNLYLGAEASEYASGIGTMFLVAMVARIVKPGCKADYMLVLEGEQGAGKSTACRILGGEWFSDSLPALQQDAVRVSQHLRGKWVLEVAEMQAMSKAEAAELKAFITRTEERFTPKYARREVVEPRQCVFIGTTNKDEYLGDETGGRRFWPVKVGMVDKNALARDRDQLLAEAIALYRGGQPWWPEGDFEAQHIRREQEDRFEPDPWETVIRRHLAARSETTTEEVLRDAIGLDHSKISRREQMRVAAILKRLGWMQRRLPGGTQRVYVRAV